MTRQITQHTFMVFVNSVIRISTKTKANCFSIRKRRTPFVWRCCATDANHRLHIMYIKNLFCHTGLGTLYPRNYPQKLESAPGTNDFLGLGMRMGTDGTDTKSTCVLTSLRFFFVNIRVKSVPNAKPMTKSYILGCTCFNLYKLC